MVVTVTAFLDIWSSRRQQVFGLKNRICVVLLSNHFNRLS